jgi:NAD(P)-dependent dehydrogenase (short-subunit alcohol dehydrogenase family)
MATDLDEIIRNLTGFYDFTGKTIIAVGAGGGQLAGYARAARRVIAVDTDEAALERFAMRVKECGFVGELRLVPEDLLAVRPQGDALLFEFCLHEMSDPVRALDHAAGLAPDVLVIDHVPGSPWVWYAAEEGGVDAGWTAVSRAKVRRQLDFEALQRFADYTELEAKMARQGSTSLERIGSFRAQHAISIPMPYRLALL